MSEELDILPRDREALLDELWMSWCATLTQIEDYLDDGVPLVIRYKFSYGTDPLWLLKNGLMRRIAEILANPKVLVKADLQERVTEILAKAQMEGPK